MRILFLLALFTASESFAQITGKVIATKGEPLPFANVILYTAQDSVIAAGTTTDEKGIFLLNYSKEGTFYLQVRSIGYKTFQSGSFTLTATNPSIQLPDLRLLEENNSLNEVVVSAKKELIQNTPVGKVINIQSSLMTKGSNALQVLERLPGVISDRRNNQFSLNGQSGVTILFNGRKVPMSMEELMTLLENTVADNIEKIELITSPTAQYDADGGAGIINIVFKKNENEGTKVNFSATAGYGFREKGVTSLGISQGFKKVNLYTSYSFLHDVSRSGFMGEGTAGASFMLGETFNTFYGMSRRFQNTHNVNVNIDYQPNRKTTIGGEFLFSFGRSHNLVNNGGTYELKNADFIKMTAFSDGLNTKQNTISSVYFKQKTSARSQLSADVSYINYSNNSPTLINSNYFDREENEIVPENPIFTFGNRGESVSKIQVGVFKTDYNIQLNTKISAEFGIKGSYSNSVNDSKVERKVNDVWQIDPRSQSSIYSQERIAAAYSQFKFLVSPKSNLHVGVRYEYWQRDINIYKDAFVIANLFPSLLYTHTLNDKSNFSINYSRRISRPAYTDLISNLFYNDPTFVFSGNPLLKPTVTDVLKTDFTTKGLTAGLSFQYDLHPILRYQITSNATKDIGISSPQNLDFQKSINLFLNYSGRIFSWWKLSVGSTTSLRDYKVSYSLTPTEKTFVFQNINFTQSLQLPGNVEIELSGWRNFPFFEGTNSIKGFGIMNLGIAKKLKNDKGTIQLSLPDVLKSFSVHTHISGMTPIVFNINTVSNWRDETAFYRVIKLTYSRSFGKSTQKINYSADNEEDKRLK
ncbi:outer membrane beta-barrel protein [Runella sp.]|uniref:outer membrane beta-barrel protein n=1 Tax=Runella sp. TaxID=1960881 RepID=UPI003D13CA96